MKYYLKQNFIIVPIVKNIIFIIINNKSKNEPKKEKN